MDTGLTLLNEVLERSAKEEKKARSSRKDDKDHKRYTAREDIMILKEHFRFDNKSKSFDWIAGKVGRTKSSVAGRYYWLQRNNVKLIKDPKHLNDYLSYPDKSYNAKEVNDNTEDISHEDIVAEDVKVESKETTSEDLRVQIIKVMYEKDEFKTIDSIVDFIDSMGEEERRYTISKIVGNNTSIFISFIKEIL